MKETADVVVIGAGIIGLSIAYQLARRSRLKIVVLEKDRNVAAGSTGASSAILRYRYSFDEMVQLAKDGIACYRDWSRFTGLPRPRAEFQRAGVLWMSGEDTAWADKEQHRLAGLNVAASVLDDTELKQRFPSFSPCVIAPDILGGEAHVCHGGGRHLLEIDAGYIDPVAALEDLLEACRRESVEVSFGVTVAKVLTDEEKVTGIATSDGARLSAGWVVNAAGPWCNRILAQLDVAFPWTLTPTRIQVLYVDRPDAVQLPIPVCLDMTSGIYFRPQNRGAQIVLGSTRLDDEQEVVEDPDNFERNTDTDFETARLHALHHRFPTWPYRCKVRGYCGMYTVNQEDFHPVVGATALPGFIVAVGFSGHGFKLAPAVGSLIAQLLTHGSIDDDTQASSSFLSVARTPLMLATKSVLA
ncbi:MAG: FAD-dependent oxidoreductase [Gammaproteobacteria bacterium]|nr:FAD-dependent oxidoreductase [Gammaproteobacteria bacterium]